MERVYYFINSYPGMYLTQAVFHSVVAAILADCSIIAWRITDPVRRQFLRISVIMIPILSFPLFQLINPDRGAVLFRLDTLMDTSGWLLLELWGKVPVIWFFCFVLLLAAFIFIFQEFLPILLHTIRSVREKDETAVDEDDGSEPLQERYSDAVMRVLDSLPDPRPDIEIIDDDDLVVFSSTGRVPLVYVSTGLIDAFDHEQLRGAVAHEIAHIRRTRKPVLTMLFIFRAMMFFNPVALFEFRRAVQDEEEICDDEAVIATGNPLALSGALGRMTLEPDEHKADEGGDAVVSIAHHSHDIMLGKRIARLSRADGSGMAARGKGSRLYYPVFVLTTAVMNYYIV